MFDQQFRVPGTQFRFGLDAVIGLVPVLGDSFGAIVSLYLVWEALRLRVGLATVIRMLINIAIDWLVGLIPLADILFDAVFKANVKNARLIARAIDSRQRVRKHPSSGIREYS